MSGPRLEFGLSCPSSKEVADTLRGVRARGFASMPEDAQRAIASQGGKAAHAAGRAHQYSREEAKQHGKTGGSKATKEHLQAIGSKGGARRAANDRQRFETVIHFGGRTRPEAANGFRLVVRDRHVVRVEPPEFSAYVGELVWNRPQVGRRVMLRNPATEHSYYLPWLVAKIERREITAQPAVQS